ncbi:hypothetical protein [Kineosporia sp. NBRC 101731]|uniref:hypothetical protein n=1 Tax=Kineosporia sp. NBRC 101731 TaxID=3032199 RepID=UPI0024A381AD|nr:hypothetical protein [Kineosporia sp. NBRC 101731]GLY27437.1 hypothetical protein Kisp02_08020 [Kineosporia sp. NBRC 101731]
MSQDQEPDDADAEEQSERARRARLEEQNRRLRRFNLDVDVCHQINGALLTEYRRAPQRGSAGGPGSYAYEGGLSELTVQLEERGYDRHDVVNLPVMVSESLKTGVVITSGDAYTGVWNAGVMPSTRYRKGGVAHHAIRANRMPGQDVIGQILSREELPPVVEGLAERVDRILGGFALYLYLFRIDWAQLEVRSEFSLPAPKQESGHIRRFLDRNAIPPYPIPEGRTPDQEAEIDFEIE